MFQPTSSINSLGVTSNGVYVFSGLTCTLDSSAVNNIQDYGFPISTPAVLVNVYSDKFSIGWSVLNPNTNNIADLNDGVFSYFTVQLLDKTNKLVSVLNSSLRNSTYFFDSSNLASLSQTLYSDENYLRDCRLLITSYNISVETEIGRAHV